MQITPTAEKTDPRITWLCEKMPETFGAAYAAVQQAKADEAANRAKYAAQKLPGEAA